MYVNLIILSLLIFRFDLKPSIVAKGSVSFSSPLKCNINVLPWSV